MSKKTVVQVTWLDSGHQEGEMDEESIKNLHPVRMVSFGLLMVNDDERVIISNHACIYVCESGDTHMDYRDTLCIPRNSIISVDVLGEVKVE